MFSQMPLQTLLCNLFLNEQDLWTLPVRIPSVLPHLKERAAFLVQADPPLLSFPIIAELDFPNVSQFRCKLDSMFPSLPFLGSVGGQELLRHGNQMSELSFLRRISCRRIAKIRG
jgi:hypothetical protein